MKLGTKQIAIVIALLAIIVIQACASSNSPQVNPQSNAKGALSASPNFKVSFSLGKDTLVCDTCRTTFKAKTGEGISGPCVAYPKAAVQYEIRDGKAEMNGNDLLMAYQNTMKPDWP